MIMFKTVIKELDYIIHPNNVKKITMDGKQVEHTVLRSINVFVMAYLMVFVASVLLISLDNFDLTTNFTAVAATLNNIGPGLGGVGPMANFGSYSGFSKIVMTFDMIAGAAGAVSGADFVFLANLEEVEIGGKNRKSLKNLIFFMKIRPFSTGNF